MKKRILATLLCVLMVVMAFPFTSSAATYIDYCYGVQVEEPHPGRNPDYEPVLLDSRFDVYRTYWFEVVPGSSYPDVDETDTFTEGKDYICQVILKYNKTKYSCDKSTQAYINDNLGTISYIDSIDSTYGLIYVHYRFTCTEGVITSSMTPSANITVPVAGSTPNYNPVLGEQHYNCKYQIVDEVNSVLWFKIDPSSVDISDLGTVDPNRISKAKKERMKSDDVFEAGYIYAFGVTVMPETGYTFQDNISFNINGVNSIVFQNPNGIAAVRCFRCTGTTKTVNIKDVEEPVAGKFANPKFTVDTGSLFGEQTVTAAFLPVVPSTSAKATELQGEKWEQEGEGNAKIFECGKNYMYCNWAGYKGYDIQISSKAPVYINGKLADASAVLSSGNTVLAYNLYKNIECDTVDTFTDMRPKSHWAHNALDFAYAQGLISGTSDTTISPKVGLSRAMIVQILWNFDGKPEMGTNSFTDVKSGSWYEKAVAWAAYCGVASGTSDTTFDPKGVCTREQLALILKNYAEYCGYDTTSRDDLTSFGDASRIHSWAEEAVKWAVAEGFIAGSNGNVMPRDNCTREQFALIMENFILAYACPPTAIAFNQPQ